MKRILTIVPVLIVAVAVGFILYRGTVLADDSQAPVAGVTVTDGAASQAYGIPEQITFTRPVESVTFSHETHIGDLGFKCDSCHTRLFDMQAHSAEENPDFNMAGLAEGKYCGSCHSAETDVAFASDTQCARCHTGVKGLPEEEATNNNQEG